MNFLHAKYEYIQISHVATDEYNLSMNLTPKHSYVCINLQHFWEKKFTLFCQISKSSILQML